MSWREDTTFLHRRTQTGAARVLVVAGNPSERGSLAARLQAAGHEVLLARSGSMAILAAREHAPDFVVLGDHLPDVTAGELCRRLKSDPQLQEVFVLSVTSEWAPGEGPSDADDHLDGGGAAGEMERRLSVLRRFLHAERRAQTKHRLLHAVFDASPAMLAVTDTSGAAMLLSRSLEALTGLRETDVRGMDLVTLLFPEMLRGAARERLAKPIGSDPAAEQELPWQTESGRRGWVRWRWVPFLAPAEEGLQLLWSGLSIPEPDRRQGD